MLAETVAVTLQASVRAAITGLGGAVASVGAGLAVGFSALVYSSKLADGELSERYAFSIPISDISSNLEQDLNAIAVAGGAIDLPYRVSSKPTVDGHSELLIVKTDGLSVPSKVRVAAAKFKSEQNVYAVTTADIPPRTFTWTPIVDLGNSSTTLPFESPASSIYNGATITLVEGRIDTFPVISDVSFDDFITVFPVGSGLPPIYTMFRDPREDAGIASGAGQPVSGTWLSAASRGEGAPVPSQIADQLRGKEFKHFRAFREAFWIAVTNHSELARQFDPGSLAALAKGYSAFVKRSDRAGGRVKYELHHKVYISRNGDIYNFDNISIVTPKRHIEIHQENKS